MIPKLIHLIWIGEPVPETVDNSIEHWQKKAPGYEVRLYRDTSLIWPAWQTESDAHIADSKIAVQAKYDLLRLSILRQFGGWYADIDVKIFSLDSFEIPGDRMAITHYGSQKSTPQNDILACTTDWKGWPLVDQYIAQSPGVRRFTKYNVALFAWLKAMQKDCFFSIPYDIVDERFGHKWNRKLSDTCDTCTDRPADCWKAKKYGCTKDRAAARKAFLKSGGCPHGRESQVYRPTPLP